ncbi:hypothetical protein [Streptomyces sp. NPDC005407]|uniref:hypothetical protein n=1 Tax=Streptomyces sp. NPDC005407 TaxID=3155340 RepID=UPI0033B1A55F
MPPMDSVERRLACPDYQAATFYLVHIGGHVVLRVPGDDITGQEKAGLDASVERLAGRRNTVAAAADPAASNGDAGSGRSQSEARRLTPTVSMRTKSAIAV